MEIQEIIRRWRGCVGPPAIGTIGHRERRMADSPLAFRSGRRGINGMAITSRRPGNGPEATTYVRPFAAR